MRQDIQILPDNRLFPTVMNINQGQNKIETALYSMENYVVNEVDLSTCDWYAVLMGVYGLDEVKLTHEVDEGVLKVRWDLNDYVTNIGQTLTYQIVAKNSEAAVYYTNKGIILNSQSIHADEFIVSNYPSILRQWEDYMKDLGDSANLKAYVVMDLDNYIPVNERVEGKFYINRLTDYDYSCLIEDSEGNVIAPSARGVSYDPSNTGILANNVQDAIDNLVKKSNGLNRFCVNEGNSTDGVEDLLDFSDSTLSFKVGGSYPNVVATKADGTTFTKSSVDSNSVSSFVNGVYNIFMDETSIELLNNNILIEGQESIAVNEDILYDSVNKVAKQYLQGGLQYNRNNATTSNICYGIASNDTTKIICGNTGTILSSTDGITWTKRNSNINYNLNDVTWIGSAFIAVGNNATITRSTDGITWSKITQTDITTSHHYRAVASDGQIVVACGDNLLTAYSLDGGVNWTSSISSDFSVYTGVAYGNGRFVMVANNGVVKTSTNGQNWEGNLTYAANFTRIRYIGDRFFATASDGRVFYSTDGLGWGVWNINLNVHLNDITKFDDYYILLSNSGNIFYSPDYVSTPIQMQIDSESSFRSAVDGSIISTNGNLYELEIGSTWVDYTKVPLGSVIVSGGVITSVETFPYNYTQYNGLIATPSTFGLMRVAAPTDEVDCSCNDASITPSNLYDLSNYRRANTEYNVDDTVGCPYHHNIQLKCIVAGTTSSEALNTKGVLEINDTIVDGEVTWRVEEVGSGGTTITYWE